jgi:DNA-binding MarR family transcriptional regulator
MAVRTPEATVISRELTATVTQLRRALRRGIRAEHPWGSRPVAQIEILQTLRETGPVRLGDLAARLNLAQSTVSALVTALDADGLAERTVDTTDRRAAVVRLSAGGRTHLRAWDTAHRKRIGQALRRLAADDRAAIAAALPALARLADTLQRDAGRPG